MKTHEVRQKFLDFFVEKQHHWVASANLVPENDPSLLFVNAGMVQFKDVFLGRTVLDYTRAVTAQCCVRAGGKHNDLENVGYTARHHTFFEMLGNFSFGDYSKREAIQFAWEFLTQILKLPPEKLWVTVYRDDTEAESIWLNELKIDPHRFSRCGEADNFWAMGDTGPCGPCSEIFYDHGPEIPGFPPGAPELIAHPDLDPGDRYIEIWNLVFMQFNRDSDGRLQALPKPSVDTGMGLERISAVMQGVHSNYQIDLFQVLIQAIQDYFNFKLTQSNSSDSRYASCCVIADHLRACSFLIANGVQPSNEGRGYVLRRILRRAIRHGQQLGADQNFFAELVPVLIHAMGESYAILKKNQTKIQTILDREETQFRRTLKQGLILLDQELNILNQKKLKNPVLSGNIIFQLYDTYGFPVDLTQAVLKERGVQADLEGFETEMAKQRLRAKSASGFSAPIGIDVSSENSKTDFLGYHALSTLSQVSALFPGQEITEQSKKISQLNAGEFGVVILSETPFYAEAGGQVGDQGFFSWENSGQFLVKTTQKYQDQYLHYGQVISGTLRDNQAVTAHVDSLLRQKTACHHSATHLLHAALRHILGETVQQKGSLVAPDRLRFDFTFDRPLTELELAQIEQLVSQKIWENTPVLIKEMSRTDALATGAMALFSEKYSESVRVLEMGGDNFSKELCGGTHVTRTGDIGLFKIIQETGIASGIRRIEAVSQQACLDYLQSEKNKLLDQLEKLTQDSKKNAQENASLKQKLVLETNLDSEIITLESLSLKILAASVPMASDLKVLRVLADRYRDRLAAAVIVLAATGAPDPKKTPVLVSVSPKLAHQYSAKKLLSVLNTQLGGSGGGREEIAQGAITELQGLSKIVLEWCEQQKS